MSRRQTRFRTASAPTSIAFDVVDTSIHNIAHNLLPMTTTVEPDPHYLYPFQPMPDKCPVPRGVISFIGGNMDKNRPRFVLWRDKEQIVVEAMIEGDCNEGLDPNDECFGYYSTCAESKRYADALEVIQGLLRYIDFKATNWAYLLKDRNNQYYIKQKQFHLPSVTTKPWTTYIPERDVEFTVWGSCTDRRGIWKGKKVDVMYGWNNLEIWALDRAMRGARAVEGLDLTFEVYGHLVGDDGNIIGLVTEAASGRMIKLSDKGLVYSAISKLQSHGFIYRGCITNRFMIHNGKVRLIELNCIEPYSDRKQLEKDAERWHWEELRDLFGQWNEFGTHRVPPARFISSWKTLEFMYPIPSPELPRGGFHVSRAFFEKFFTKYWPSHRETLLMEKFTAEDEASRTESSSDVPLSSRQILSLRDATRATFSVSRRPRSRPVLAPSGHPYSRRAPRPGKALTSSSDTSQSSNNNLLNAPITVSIPFDSLMATYGLHNFSSYAYATPADAVVRSDSPDNVDKFFLMAGEILDPGHNFYNSE
ncbi:hypothetical protein BDN70DRAFT_917909 [Pholiota conissans]|uniref:Uncharacterized protein n=1 Tax=Pholiota conissans TaxID=109636 RepID=A0A9P5ZAQ4_9AGAR|nr:hypothetical protein BDN70DRAFT_917909 [Pholiota conissans]